MDVPSWMSILGFVALAVVFVLPPSLHCGPHLARGSEFYTCDFRYQIHLRNTNSQRHGQSEVLTEWISFRNVFINFTRLWNATQICIYCWPATSSGCHRNVQPTEDGEVLCWVVRPRRDIQKYMPELYFFLQELKIVKKMRHSPVTACCCNKPRTHKSAALNSKTWGKEGIQLWTLWKNLYVKGWRLAFCSSFILSAPFVRQIACMWMELRLTRPPVASASFPMSAKRQSVPSKVITDIMTLQEKKNKTMHKGQFAHNRQYKVWSASSKLIM